MLNLHKKLLFKRILIASACSMAAVGVSAQQLALENASFEEPLIDVIDFSTPEVQALLGTITNQFEAQLVIGNLVARDVFSEASLGGDPQLGWLQTGPQFIGRNSSGVFSNQPINLPELGFVVPPIPNTVGDGVAFDQLGFMLADPSANGGNEEGDEDFVSIYQQSTDVFEAGKDYSFTLAVGQAVTFSAGDSAPLRIAIGTLNDTPGLEGSEVFNEIVGQDIFASELDNSGIGTLRDFSVVFDELDLNPSLLGENIAVQIRVAVPDDLEGEELFNTGGAFNYDNARLAVVPEPTSLALLSLGGLALLRRRR